MRPAAAGTYDPITARRILILALCTLTLAFALAGAPAHAHGGEDHSHDAAPVPQRADAPRAYAESEDFELVVSLEGERLLIHLDHWASNAPVEDADIEVEGGGVRLRAQHLGAGLYAVPAEAYTQPGRHALVFTVQAGELADLLVAHLEVPETAVTVPPHGLPAWTAWSVVGGLLLAAFAFAAWRRRTRARGGAA